MVPHSLVKHACGLLVVALPATISAHAQAYTRMVAFGASHVDTGNVYALANMPPSPPYYAGRFSNGPVYLEYYAERMGLAPPTPSVLGGANYAFAGATTGLVENLFGVPNVDDQIALYLSANTPTADELFLVTAGGNDYTASGGTADPALTAGALADLVETLAAAGARHFAVSNELASGDAQQASWAASFDVSLRQEIAGLRAAQPELAIALLDVRGIYQKVAADPAAYGFVNVTDPACADCGIGATPDPTNIVSNPNQYFFWDTVHWTTAAHRIVAAPEPISGLLACVALLPALAARRASRRCGDLK
jgi:phospholipase/lecithinase/hemolysin